MLTPRIAACRLPSRACKACFSAGENAAGESRISAFAASGVGRWRLHSTPSQRLSSMIETGRDLYCNRLATIGKGYGSTHDLAVSGNFMSCLHVDPRWHGQPQCCITLQLLLLLCFEQQSALNPGNSKLPPTEKEYLALKAANIEATSALPVSPGLPGLPIPRLRASMMLSGCGGHLRQGSTPLQKSDTWVCLCESCFLVKGNHNETNHLEAPPNLRQNQFVEMWTSYAAQNSYIRSKHQ